MKPVEFKFCTNKLEFGSLSKGQGKTDEKFYVRGYASTPDLDRQDELITWEALKKVEDHLVKNSTLFFDHNSRVCCPPKVYLFEVTQPKYSYELPTIANNTAK